MQFTFNGFILHIWNHGKNGILYNHRQDSGFHVLCMFYAHIFTLCKIIHECNPWFSLTIWLRARRYASGNVEILFSCNMAQIDWFWGLSISSMVIVNKSAIFGFPNFIHIIYSMYYQENYARNIILWSCIYLIPMNCAFNIFSWRYLPFKLELSPFAHSLQGHLRSDDDTYIHNYLLFCTHMYSLCVWRNEQCGWLGFFYLFTIHTRNFLG